MGSASRISRPGFEQFGNDVLHGGNADPAGLRHGVFALRFDLVRQILDFARAHVLVGIPEERKELFRALVRFRVHRGVVENVIPVGNAQKSRALLKGLFAELVILEYLFARPETAVFVAGI